MSRGYGKFRRGNAHTPSFHFDSLFKENTNRPSAARSAATVGKWGITSFTSIRTINGENVKSKSPPEHTAPKPKKFFKSRNADPPDLKQGIYEKPDLTYGNANKKQKTLSADSNKTSRNSSKKFFASKNPEKTVLTSNLNNSKPSDSKPPIVLRICHGKSQLINSSDESESTPTPSSTPSTSTSPRTLRDTTQRSPCHMRITRSTRRSMQQEPNSSPATGDTAGDTFPSITSPKKDLDLSPQYIPAEKYELERKAMYDNLLGITTSETMESMEIARSSPDGEMLSMEYDEPLSDNQFESVTKESLSPENNILEVEPEDDEEDDGEEKMEICTDIITDITIHEENKPISCETPLEKSDIPGDQDKVDVTSVNTLSQSSNKSFEEDWSSDSDSNSTAPEPTEHERRSRKHIIEEHKKEILEKILEKPPLESPAPVKIVISKKKGSIFKSRVPDGTKKRRALYKHKWSDDKDANQNNTENASNSATAASREYDEFGFQDDPLTRISKDSEDSDAGYTSVKCTKQDKGYYTVVRNVKKAHQIQEIGEFQEFNVDVDYILDALQDNNPISTRCLSAITLASKCMVPAFRMHLRAHGTVAKFFKALHDATKDQRAPHM